MFDRLLFRGRGNYARFIGRSILFLYSGIIVVTLAYHLPEVIAALKVSINGQPLYGFYIYTLFFVFLSLPIMVCRTIAEQLADMIGDWPARGVIYCFIMNIVGGISLYLYYCFVSTRDNAESVMEVS
ncbi:hypothetical protein PFISCL1PPCAC_24537, partial [Pristionchus fissidentatus]